MGSFEWFHGCLSAQRLADFMDSDQFMEATAYLAEYIVAYRNGLISGCKHVLPDFEKIRPGYLRALLPETAPEVGEPFSALMSDVTEKIMPGMTHWQHPNFHAYFPTCATYPSLLGDFLSLAIAPLGLTWLSCPACTELEVIVLDWLVHAFGLPKKFLSSGNSANNFETNGGGTIESSASLACATLVLGVRERALTQLAGEQKCNPDGLHGRNVTEHLNRLVGYTSDQAHCSVFRAFRIAMIRYRELPTERVGRKRVFNAKVLCKVIARDVSLGLIPLICVATMGTTSTCEFDDIEAIGRVCKQYNVWLHLDAAYAGAALLCPEYRYLANGVEFADSFCFNGNKLLRVHFDCSIMWFADHRVITKAFEEEVTYLRSDFQGMPEYRNWSISLARRFRALKLWFTLRAYGLEELRNYIRQHVAMANAFKHLVSLDERFEICNDVRFGLVCFRLKGKNGLTQELNDWLLKDGRVFMVPGSLKDAKNQHTTVYFLRFVASPQTMLANVHFTYEVISEAAEMVLVSSRIQEFREGVTSKH
ncbi:hypothetical protein P879_06909 [Paragonimus westermani]|uniref:Aromatic-L-amino-acid decarboxylase n=1 Tax=Paragonimus westermani TaxID=34504 RepID=A0A8T0DLP0_9TREM|nr:hypothetical protein P879_06909 [Paragonimus westermani]